MIQEKSFCFSVNYVEEGTATVIVVAQDVKEALAKLTCGDVEDVLDTDWGVIDYDSTTAELIDVEEI